MELSGKFSHMQSLAVGKAKMMKREGEPEHTGDSEGNSTLISNANLDKRRIRPRFYNLQNPESLK